MNVISGNTYEELYEVLRYMDKPTVMKIPESILRNILEKRNKEFETRIDKNDLFKEENMSKEAVDILCWLEYKFLMSEENKKEIDKIKNRKLKEMENKNYDLNNLFKKKEIAEAHINNIQLIEKKEKSWLKKILDNIIKFFARKKFS